MSYQERPLVETLEGYSCLCKKIDTMEMVECEMCCKWFHFSCVGVTSDIKNHPWACKNCFTATMFPNGRKNKSVASQGSNHSKSVNIIEPPVAETANQNLNDIANKTKSFNGNAPSSKNSGATAASIRRARIEYLEGLKKVQEQRASEEMAILKKLAELRERTAREKEEILKLRYETMVRQINSDDSDGEGELLGPRSKSRSMSPISKTQEWLRQHKHHNNNTNSPVQDPVKNNTQLMQAATENINECLIVQPTPTKVIDNCIQNATVPSGSQKTNLHKDEDVGKLTKTQIAARQVLHRDLPNFSGNSDEWPLFISNFNQSTKRCGYSQQENLIRLQKCLKGNALKAVHGRLLIPETVPRVIETLEMLYGRTEVILDSLIMKITNEPAIKSDRLDMLVNYGLAVQNLCSTIESMSKPEYLNNPMLLRSLVGKLPAHLQLKWGELQTVNPNSTISNFNNWLYELANFASKVPSSTTVPTQVNEKVSNRFTKEKVFFHGTNVQSSVQTNKMISAEDIKVYCGVCKGDHRVNNCEQFLKMDKAKRWERIRQLGLCGICFGHHHYKRCKARRACGVDGCRTWHHPLLHHPKAEFVKASANETTKSNDTTTSAVALHHEIKSRSVLFRIVPITLYNSSKSVETFAFIDGGSSVSLMETRVADELGLKGPEKDLQLKWTNDICRVESKSRCISVMISASQSNGQKYRLNNVRTIDDLNLPMQSINMDDFEELAYIKGLPIKSYINAVPTVLIGMDNYSLGVPRTVREGKKQEPVAVKTQLGWMVCGPQSEIENRSTEHCFHICECHREDKKLHELVKDHFALENLGVSASKTELLSKNDSRALEILEKTTCRINGRFQTGLLWKYDNVEFPDSWPMAMKRLECLERKMQRDDNLATELKRQIAEYLENGYARKLKEKDNHRDPRTWYLPIFTVTNPNKPEKTRLVWDAAATVKQVSLNSMLLKGPEFLVPLPSVLFGFREHAIAVCGDIRHMFHQVRVRQEDQNSQRFLWRDGETNRPPDIYIMEVMTFGSSCSPCSAHFVKNKNALEHAATKPRAVIAITDRHYVDDWLDSVEDEKEMVELIEDVIHIHKMGGFDIRNWMSNSPEVLQSIGASPSTGAKDIGSLESTTEKVLGMFWCPDSDCFTYILRKHRFDASLIDGRRIPTKREALRILMIIYDPLGLISHFLVYLKIILQEAWRSQIDWDCELKPAQYEKWKLWTDVLVSIEDLRIPRCYSLTKGKKYVELHTFVDASESAYASISYLRIQSGENVECALVGSKSRVAPTKPLSIPRLELLAAVLGARYAKFIMKSHSLVISRRVFWSDSQNVLSWIRSDARKYKQFVALRIGELLDLTDIKEWRWVPSDDNVADEGTKWKTPPKMVSSARWFTGPEFLKLPESEWPNQKGRKTDEDQNEEYVAVIENKITPAEVSSVSPDPGRYSKWSKLLRVQGYVIRYVNNVRAKSLHQDLRTGPLLVDELMRAEKILFRKCQQDHFRETIQRLKGDKLPKTDKLYHHSPYLDSDGLLRVSGRIDLAEHVEFDVKRPIILPYKHRITILLVDSYHRKFRHMNHDIVVNEIKQRFSISKLRVVLKGVRNECVHCKIKKAMPQPPQMGNLPLARLSSFTRPFTCVGLDYFGPIEIVIGRRVEKRWGALFTCLTTRAIHLEVANSLSTSSCIIVIRNFIGRRGAPREFFSDNGTNFRGADTQLIDEINKIDKDRLREDFGIIKWTFNPPSSPHMGGSWERLVRSVKSILVEVIPKTRKPDDELLRSALIEVEAIINSRPLTEIPLDDESSEALTPNHFLVGSSGGVKPFGDFTDDKLILKQNWKKSEQIANSFWKRWVREYLPTLTRRGKWFEKVKPIEVGNVVIIVDENMPRNTWKKGIVIDVHVGANDQVRSAVVKTTSGIYNRPAVKLAVLDILGVKSAPANLQGGSVSDGGAASGQP